MRKQNSFEIVFQDNSKFYAQNPIIGILLSKIESGKLTNKSVKKCLNKTPNPKDIELNQKLQRLKAFNNNLSRVNDSDDDNDGGLPPPPSMRPTSTSPTSLSKIVAMLKQEEKPVMSEKLNKLL